MYWPVQCSARLAEELGAGPASANTARPCCPREFALTTRSLRFVE
ncbi:hypothetical protein GQ600_26580 [Phytophthora cactorum]|nr:hypothetical protein GQ600_26580 [Phytophthora cactorum]